MSFQENFDKTAERSAKDMWEKYQAGQLRQIAFAGPIQHYPSGNTTVTRDMVDDVISKAREHREFVETWYWRIIQSLVYEGVSLQTAKQAARRVFLTHLNIHVEDVFPCEKATP